MLHLVADINDPFEAEFFIESLAKLCIFLSQANGFNGLAGDRSEPSGSDRLFQKVEGPMLHRFDRFGDRGMTGNHDHFTVGEHFASLSQQLHTIDIIHHQIGDDHIVSILVDHLRTFWSAGGDGATITDTFQALGHGTSVCPIVIHDQYRILASVGFRFG